MLTTLTTSEQAGPVLERDREDTDDHPRVRRDEVKLLGLSQEEVQILLEKLVDVLFPNLLERSGLVPLAVVGCVAGIGFTMALFIAELAFPEGPLLETAKLAVLAASGALGVLGLVAGAAVLRADRGASTETGAGLIHARPPFRRISEQLHGRLFAALL